MKSWSNARAGALSLYAAFIASAAGALWPAAAAANQYGIFATISTPSGAMTSPLTIAQLASCTTSLPNGSQIYLNGQDPTTSFGGGTVTSDNWTLASILTCGYGIPIDPNLQVAVENPNGAPGYQPPLSADQLTKTTSWAQPPSGYVPFVPLVNTEGTSGIDQIVYYQPWAGGNDPNANALVADASGVLHIEIDPGVTSLTVDPTVTAANELTRSFAASVSEAGLPIPASELTWHWTFGDGASSTQAAPTHTFSTAGSYTVTANVTFPRLGLPGVQSLPVSVGTPSGQTTTVNPGTGGSKKATSPNGPDKSSGKTPGTPSGHKQGTSRHAKHHTKHQVSQPTEPSGGLNDVGGRGNGSGTGTGDGSGLGTSGSGTGLGGAGRSDTTASGAGESSTATTSTTATRSGAGTAHHLPSAVKPPQRRREPLTGVLVSAVAPRSSSAGHDAGSGSPANAPAARAKAPTPISTAVIAGLGALLLLGFGIAREIHRGRRPRPRRMPSWFGRPRPSA